MDEFLNIFFVSLKSTSQKCVSEHEEEEEDDDDDGGGNHLEFSLSRSLLNNPS